MDAGAAEADAAEAGAARTRGARAHTSCDSLTPLLSSMATREQTVLVKPAASKSASVYSLLTAASEGRTLTLGCNRSSVTEPPPAAPSLRRAARSTSRE